MLGGWASVRVVCIFGKTFIVSVFYTKAFILHKSWKEGVIPPIHPARIYSYQEILFTFILSYYQTFSLKQFLVLGSIIEQPIILFLMDFIIFSIGLMRELGILWEGLLGEL